MRSLINKIFEKNGQVKLIGSMILCVLFSILWNKSYMWGETYTLIFKILFAIPAIYLGLFLLISLSFAWVINPIKKLKEKKNKK